MEGSAAWSRAMHKMCSSVRPTVSTKRLKLSLLPSTEIILSPTCSWPATGPLGSTSTMVFIASIPKPSRPVPFSRRILTSISSMRRGAAPLSGTSFFALSRRGEGGCVDMRAYLTMSWCVRCGTITSLSIRWPNVLLSTATILSPYCSSPCVATEPPGSTSTMMLSRVSPMPSPSCCRSSWHESSHISSTGPFTSFFLPMPNSPFFCAAPPEPSSYGPPLYGRNSMGACAAVPGFAPPSPPASPLEVYMASYCAFICR
mmetsp:Transcript_25627/g.76218  ORF Transcript_25627/g.76218 Transcript_25627/m.76218 type:complete len:258 (-) Transcript_25627:753-1526(-)